jgi:methyl-accepting chemotaxis protein
MLQTIKARALLAGITTMCVTIGIAAISLLFGHRLVDDLEETRRIASALRNHTIADMHHDGLQSSAYAALSAGELKVPRGEIEKKLRERAGKFRQAVANNAKLDLPADVRTRLQGLAEPLAAYIDAAENIVRLAFDDRAAALAGIGAFNAKFENLETAMDVAGDHIEAAAKAIDDSASAFSRIAVVAELAALVIGATVTPMLLAYIVFGMLRPLARIERAMRELANRNFNIVLPGLDRRDEIGAMAGSIEIFRRNMVENDRLHVEQTQADVRAVEERRLAQEHEFAARKAVEEEAAAERRTAMQLLADKFESAVGSIIDKVSLHSTELETAANGLTRTAESTQQLSGAVASASADASVKVQSVAEATEKMTDSVEEISRRVQESSQIADEAVGQAGKTDVRITELSQAATRIGDVIKLITAIAEQTNLLALNATIEAARAGEAGKGFAVVAQEVKALAAQTAKATGEIGNQIAGMQVATNDAVAAIKEIGGTIGRISQIATAIAAAVDEQGTATAEIARNVQEVAHGTTEVADNIGSVNRGASDTGSASSQVLSSARALASESGYLKTEVRNFLAMVRAA